MRVHSFTLSHTLGNLKCDFQALDLTCTFVTPCLSREPKVRVETTFPICLTILCMPIPIIFFSSFPITWGSHNHSIKIKYMIGNPLGRTLFALARLHTLCHITITHLTCTIVMLEKLLGARSFGGSINHLACRQAILLAYLGEFDLPFIIRSIALAFLRCQALITPTLSFISNNMITLFF